jgi:biopolymer transport protein ExbD
MKRMDQINVIPFIDIMLVLLAIVLTTATFIAEGRLQIRLPVAQDQATSAPVKPVEIAIDAEGAVFFGTDALGVGPEGLAALGGRLDTLAPETPIELRVDAQARFERFVGVVDRLKARGLDRLTILTRRP